jgi:molybdenum cofactor synthesis domain-containing protein
MFSFGLGRLAAVTLQMSQVQLTNVAWAPGAPSQRILRGYGIAGDMEPTRVITVSDRGAAGERVDLSGPAVAAALTAAGYETTVVVVPDGEGPVSDTLRLAVADRARLIVTTGGTGIGPRDRTPEATAMVIDHKLPGIAEVLRAEGLGADDGCDLAAGALSRGRWTV